MQDKIILENFSKRYKRKWALREVSLEIPLGKSIAFLGPNGSGKSTLLKGILGLILPEEGSRIFYKGEEYPRGLSSLYKECGYMPQKYSLPSSLPVKEWIGFLEEIFLEKEPVFKKELLEKLGIEEFWEKNFEELSEGMKQKLNLLQCFMYDHEIYIIDEPTASLDPANVFLLKELIKKEKRKGKTFLFSTHVLQEVEEWADYICILADGRILFWDRKEALYKKGESLEEKVFQIFQKGSSL